MTTHDIYSIVIAENIPHASHYSDLYIPVTPRTTQIVHDHAKALKTKGLGMVKTFKNQVEGGLWYDIPFAYTPYWDAKQKKGA